MLCSPRSPSSIVCRNGTASSLPSPNDPIISSPMPNGSCRCARWDKAGRADRPCLRTSRRSDASGIALALMTATRRGPPRPSPLSAERVTNPIAFVDEGLGNSSYLLDLGDGRAMILDPARDVTPYLAAADRARLSIAFTVETHLHADFLTGSRELAARGATVLASKAAAIELPHHGFDDGD